MPAGIRARARGRSSGSLTSWGSIRRRCGTWVRQAEIDGGLRPGITTDDTSRVSELEREVRELRRANEILRTSAAFFAAAELDRKIK